MINGTHFDHISSILVSIVKDEDIAISDFIWEILLRGLKMALSGIKGINEKLFEQQQLLRTVNLASDKVKHNSDLIEIIIGICFDENLAMIISPDQLDIFYFGLVINCSNYNSEYFKVAFQQAKADVKERVGKYLNYLTIYNTAHLCIDNLMNLSPNSDNGKFRLALISVKRLRKTNQAQPEVFDLVYDAYDTFNGLVIKLSSVIFDFSHENNSLLLQIMAHISLLDIETFGDDEVEDDDEEDDDWYAKSFGNVAMSIGSLIVKSKFNEPYPQELVNDVMPRLDFFIDKLLKIIKELKKRPMNPMDLMAYMSFLRLHSNTEFVEVTVNEICFAFIISKPIRDKGYARIKDFDNIDEYSVMRAGFFYFIQKHSKTPSKSDHPYLIDYFKQLLINDFLSKTEIMAITRYFNANRIKL